MRKITLAALCLASVALAADRVITTVDLDSSVVVTKVLLNPLVDGGCSIQVIVNVDRADGGTHPDRTPDTEVAGQARTSCLDMANKGLNFYKNSRGF